MLSRWIMDGTFAWAFGIFWLLTTVAGVYISAASYGELSLWEIWEIGVTTAILMALAPLGFLLLVMQLPLWRRRS